MLPSQLRRYIIFGISSDPFVRHFPCISALGYVMNSSRSLFFLAAGAVIFLASCSGAKKTVCTVNCNGGGGDATLTLTLTDTPPSGVTFLNFNLPIASISLTPSGGGADVALLSTATNYEMTRLQADSATAGSYQVAAGTYTALNIFVTNSPSSVWINSSGATILGCAPGAVCNLSGSAPGKITIDLTKAIGGSGLVLTSNEKVGVGLDFNLNNAITTTGGIAIDLTQANVFTATTLPRTGQASGTLDTLDGITGIVTAVSSSSITVKSDFGGTFTASITSSTSLADPLSLCPGGAAIASACIATNTIVGLDAVVKTDGTLTASVIDLLSLTSGDDLEGVIIPTSDPATFELVVSDKSITSTNSTLLGVSSGAAVFLSLGSSISFGVDTKNLPITGPAGFAGSGDILAGQEVRARISAASLTSGKIDATASSMLLRYSRITATVDHTASNVLFINTLPAYLGFSTTAQQVQTFSPQTTLDGINAITDLQAGQSVTARALYLHNVAPPFLADKVRKH